MIRLACAVLSAVLFGLFSSTSAGATSQVEISTVIAYNYDDSQHPGPTADTTSERGPPSTDDRNTGSDAVDLWPGGAWSRSEMEVPARTTTNTTSAQPAPAAAVTGTTKRHVRVNSRELRARSGASVAANTGTRLRPGLTQPGVTRTLENSLDPDAYISDVVSHYGINLRGSGQSISVQFNLNLASAGRVRAASPNVIEVGPNAFASSEEMARTLAHELNHARSFLRGGVAPESTAYGAEGYLSEWMAGLR